MECFLGNSEKNPEHTMEDILEELWKKFWTSSKRIPGGSISNIYEEIPGKNLKECRINCWSYSEEIARANTEEFL